MITTTDLTKYYGPNAVVDGVDLQVSAGDRFGLLGPNGSGKTTLIAMLLGLVYATRGEITVMGRPVPKRVAHVLPRVGALVEGRPRTVTCPAGATWPWPTRPGPGGPRRTRSARIADALDRVGLGGVDDRPVKAYSLGMRQRLGLAAALLRSPALLVLDEPTNGWTRSASGRSATCWPSLNVAGTTVLLSSHLLSEVELLCTRSASWTAAGWCCSPEWTNCGGRPGRILVTSPDAERAEALLDGRVEVRDGDRLVIRETDPAALNARPGRGRAAGGRGPGGTAHAGGRGARGDAAGLRPGRPFRAYRPSGHSGRSR
jgi:ABC-2 type transport system ATP-binding protein